jgi:hypothetical protein
MIPNARPPSLIDGGAERWRQISDYPSYEVSDRGKIRRSIAYRQHPAGKLLKPKPDTGGYLQVALSRDGRYGYFNVHRLVALTFLGPPPTPRHQVAHNDGVRSHNWVANLRWATPKENCADRVLHGTSPDNRGERHPSANLTESLVTELRDHRRAGRRYNELAQTYRLPMMTIYSAVVGDTWPHVPGALGRARRPLRAK